jgi:hypothetical protein
MTSYFWKPAIDKLFMIMENVALDTSTPVIDCETPFNSMDKARLFSDVMHMTPEGNRVFASILFRYLTQDEAVGIMKKPIGTHEDVY